MKGSLHHNSVAQYFNVVGVKAGIQDCQHSCKLEFSSAGITEL
ncbi:hypothetical protein [Chryseobacterium sp. NKUCC03_KSP]|nr:hypothetical protein [Chryseobacterium sp. NKUCC03_KSP]